MRSIILLLLVVTFVISQDPLLDTEKQLLPSTWTNTNKRVGCVSSLPGFNANTECLVNFISDQMQVKGTPNNKLAATYRIGWDYQPGGKYPNTTGESLSIRADIYDSAMSAIFLLNEGKIELATKLCDTLVLLVDLDHFSDGRLRTAYDVSNPVDRQNLPSSWATYAANAVDNNIDTGDQAFVVLALTRLLVQNGDFTYLKAALKVASFIQKQIVNTAWKGYGAGFINSNGVDQKLDFRGIQQNIAIYAAANNLYGITKDAQWKEMMDNTNSFIMSMFDGNVGAYRYGTKSNSADDFNTAHLTSQAQAWKVLSGADLSESRSSAALQFVLNKLLTFDNAVDDVTGQTMRYQGVLFAEGGSGIQSEMTAAAALAFAFQARRLQATNPALATTFQNTAESLVTSLLQMQKYAPNSDGHGIVATPNKDGALVWDGDETSGQTWRYFNVLHTAASAWTGCAIAYVRGGDVYANPFSDYYKKFAAKSYFGASLITSSRSAPEPLFDTSRPLNIIALITALLFGTVLILGTVILVIANARIYKRNKELEGKRLASPIRFSAVPTATPGTPREGNGSGLTINTTPGPYFAYASPATPSGSDQQSFLKQDL